MLDGVGPLAIFFKSRDEFINKSNIRIPVRRDRLGRFRIGGGRDVTAIGESGSEEIEIGVSRDILGAWPAGGLALFLLRLITFD